MLPAKFPCPAAPTTCRSTTVIGASGLVTSTISVQRAIRQLDDGQLVGATPCRAGGRPQRVAPSTRPPQTRVGSPGGARPDHRGGAPFQVDTDHVLRLFREDAPGRSSTEHATWRRNFRARDRRRIAGSPTPRRTVRERPRCRHRRPTITSSKSRFPWPSSARPLCRSRTPSRSKMTASCGGSAPGCSKPTVQPACRVSSCALPILIRHPPRRLFPPWWRVAA